MQQLFYFVRDCFTWSSEWQHFCSSNYWESSVFSVQKKKPMSERKKCEKPRWETKWNHGLIARMARTQPPCCPTHIVSVHKIKNAKRETFYLYSSHVCSYTVSLSKALMGNFRPCLRHKNLLPSLSNFFADQIPLSPVLSLFFCPVTVLNVQFPSSLDHISNI